MTMTKLDYKSTELDIQAAMVDMATRHPDKSSRPRFIQWGEHLVTTIYDWQVPTSGTISIELLSAVSDVRQGLDVKISHGKVFLAESQVDHLRTWFDPELSKEVSYDYEASDGMLKLWNVYERRWPDGQITEEKWTGNSGFFVEEVNELEKIFHCSHGSVPNPKFDCLVVKVGIKAM